MFVLPDAFAAEYRNEVGKRSSSPGRDATKRPGRSGALAATVNRGSAIPDERKFLTRNFRSIEAYFPAISSMLVKLLSFPTPFSNLLRQPTAASPKQRRHSLMIPVPHRDPQTQRRGLLTLPRLPYPV